MSASFFVSAEILFGKLEFMKRAFRAKKLAKQAAPTKKYVLSLVVHLLEALKKLNYRSFTIIKYQRVVNMKCLSTFTWSKSGLPKLDFICLD